MHADLFASYEQKLKADKAHPLFIQTFRHYFSRFVQGQSGLISTRDLEPLDELPDFEKLTKTRSEDIAALGKTVVIQLNGGLGTSMGLDRAKSLLPVKNGLTFLDITARQILHARKTYGVHMPLLLMNSFSTDADSLEIFKTYPDLQKGQGDIPLSFLQHRIPRIREDDRTPVSWPGDPTKEWCPPGHGDLYTALVTTGLLDRLLEQGYEYAFVSNVDNLGATLDLNLLNYFAQSEASLLMEVTDRTDADKKGGHLAKVKGQGLVLREIAQCPQDELDDFQNIQKHRYFNTNNLWLNLKHIHEFLESHEGIIELPLIINRKNVDPADVSSPAVVQLETAMGSAVGVFPNSLAIRVPRTRFAPVKTTDDLLLLWSDVYELNDAAQLVKSSKRKGSLPVVKLDTNYYKLMNDFNRRFPKGAPSLLDCERFEVEGDIILGENVAIQGTVQIKNPLNRPLAIANEVMTNVKRPLYQCNL